MITTPSGYQLSSETSLPELDTHRFEYDEAQTPPSMAVVAALTETTRRDPTAFAPIQTRIDASALDTLLSSKEFVEVEFSMADHDVTVDSDGGLDIAPLPAEKSNG
jgi:hypothetical protein